MLIIAISNKLLSTTLTHAVTCYVQLNNHFECISAKYNIYINLKNTFNYINGLHVRILTPKLLFQFFNKKNSYMYKWMIMKN